MSYWRQRIQSDAGCQAGPYWDLHLANGQAKGLDLVHTVELNLVTGSQIMTELVRVNSILRGRSSGIGFERYSTRFAGKSQSW